MVTTAPQNLSLGEQILADGSYRLKQAFATFKHDYKPSPKPAPANKFDYLLLMIAYGGSTLLMDRRVAACSAEAAFRTAEMMAKGELEKTAPGSNDHRRLEEVVQNTHVGGAVATGLMAHASYDAGEAAGYTKKSGLLTRRARCNLDEAVFLYHRAFSEFMAYEDAFRAQDKFEGWLKGLLMPWLRSCLLLGADAYMRGEKMVQQSVRKDGKVNPQKAEEAIHTLSDALQRYTRAIQILNEGSERRMRLGTIGRGRLVQKLEKEIARITSKGVEFAESVGHPELIKGHFLNP